MKKGVKYRRDASGGRGIINDRSLVIVPLRNEGSNDYLMTREKYRGRLAKFFDFIGLTEGTMEERAKTFTKTGKRQPDWVFVSVMRFTVDTKRPVKEKRNVPRLKGF